MSKSVNFTQSQFFVALRRLDSWFHHQRRTLPWREKPTLYRVWISEIMLQQTQVITVIPYFERFIARFPTVKALAEAPEGSVMELWAGLGYYSRARNLHRAAKSIMAGGFPKTKAGWLDLPGVGPYTAGAILSIALDQPEPILDGNAERVLSRLHREATKANLWKHALHFVTSGFEKGLRPSVLNQALMEVGATLCSPKNPKCGKCPLFDSCLACAQGNPEEFPLKRPAKSWTKIDEELHCLLTKDDRVLLRKRASKEWRAGLWDLIEEKYIPKKGLVSLGTITTSHIVTTHKITRTTHVWRTPKTRVPNSDFRWVSFTSPDVATGAAFRRTLLGVKELVNF